MEISRPHTSPEEAQKTRDRLAGKAAPTAALGGTTETASPAPLMTAEQKKVADANLKARMDARRAAAAAAAAPVTGVTGADASSAATPAAGAPAGTTTATGAKKGTKAPAGMKTSTPAAAPGSGPSAPLVHDAHHVDPAFDHPIPTGAEPTGQTKPNQAKPSTAPTASVPAPTPDAVPAVATTAPTDTGKPNSDRFVNHTNHGHVAKGTKRTHTDDLLK